MSVKTVRLEEDQFQRLARRLERRVEEALRPGARRRVRTAAQWAQDLSTEGHQVKPDTVRSWARNPLKTDWQVTAHQGRSQLIRGPEGL